MSIEDVVLVATMREEIRGGALQVDAANIRCHIEMALAGKVNHPVGNDTYLDCLKSDVERSVSLLRVVVRDAMRMTTL